MNIRYEINIPLEAASVADVFRRSGIRRPVDDVRRIGLMLANANLTVSAWDRDRLVGIARAITDHVYCCYLSDLAVDREYQRSGIGEALVDRVRTEVGEEVSLVLISAPEAMAYYPRIGFTPSERAFVFPRKR
jgi:GNAT superfamily N-acetyltransferase